jgi:hypothetical protein
MGFPSRAGMASDPGLTNLRVVDVMPADDVERHFTVLVVESA